MSSYAIAIKNLYIAGKLTYSQVRNTYDKGLITIDEFDKIISLKTE